MRSTRLLLALGLAGLAGGVGWWLAEPAPTDAASQIARAGGQPLPAGLTPPWLPGTASEAAQALPLPVSGSPASAALQQTPAMALRTLRRCYYADNCGFNTSPEDPRAPHFAAARAIAERLQALPRDGSPAELAGLARDFMAFPDGHVQEAALSLAAALPPDAATAGAAIAMLADSHDAPLFKSALPVLDQWQKLGLSAGLDSLLQDTLRSGGLYAAQVVAENLTPFVNDANWSQYQALAQSMPEGQRRVALLQSLREYRLQKTGG